MAWEDRVQNLLGHCTSVFGRDDITHEPQDYPAQDIRAIWSDTYLSVDPETGVEVMSSDPNIGVRLSDFLRPPKKNDVIKKGPAGARVEYRIRAVEPDGEGGATLVLEKMKETP